MKFERPSSPLTIDGGRLDIQMEEAGDAYNDNNSSTKATRNERQQHSMNPRSMEIHEPHRKSNKRHKGRHGKESRIQPVFPQRFLPPTPDDTPRSLFKPLVFVSEGRPSIRRFVGRENHYQCLVYTAGACHDNWKGDENYAKAGWSFVYRPQNPSRNITGGVAGRLELMGPSRVYHQQTRTRAELRAVIAALKYLSHDGNTFDSVVVATDSSYVVNNATVWIRKWLTRDWKNAGGRPIKNRDLWEALLKEVRCCYVQGREVHLWHIDRLLNQDAVRLANWATVPDSAPIEFVEDISPS
ncbi:ribonuclease H-like protein [Aspergillus eucalypticola CBS 122712]|uniref:ribonuclease H n=1 Tax=Aspergillus eucalypticola (strain CBS 122712 / IBT 29274) TaxID=1448314 RepID=A0A317V064_ASPEC|nr:ribonuclease H-like protein [Aspergillus eucalypticola CBS 122712]PWY67039.1 ribonuclease H-like protein [Aspergillus eucalypticola CBS 122712]